jgi:DNA-binding SARP family transcriptional activator
VSAAHEHRYAILGPVELRRDGRLLPVDGRRQLELLMFLLLHANRAVASYEVHEALWSERSHNGARKRVQMSVARLRKSLAPLQANGTGPVLRTVSGGYMLAVADGELDAQAFAEQAERGQQLLDRGDARAAARLLREALDLWRGPALGELAFEEFAQAEIRRLEELRLEALETRIEADLALGHHASAVSELQTLSAAHPERDRFSRQLMLALYRCGRQRDALEVYRRVCSRLIELGLQPAPMLQSLQRAMLEQAAWLDSDGDERSLGRRADDLAPERGSAAVVGEQQAPSSARRRFPMPSALRSDERDAFVGRVDAIGRLTAAFEQVAAGSPRTVIVRGEPGIGKTRLATEFVRHAHAHGAITLFGRCDEESLLPHQPFVEALRHYVCSCDRAVLAGQLQLISGELRRVVPELGERIPDLAQPLADDREGARHRLFEAIAALLGEAARGCPVVLLIDDLQWADRATLLLLKYVARHPQTRRLMIVCTCRDTDVELMHPLDAVLADLAKNGLVETLDIGPLDESAVSELVSWHTADAAPAEVHRLVFRETEGNAFFVIEALRHLAESGSGATWTTGRLPFSAGVRTLIRQRVGHVGPDAGQVLSAAAALGHSFHFDLLKPLTGLEDEELVAMLERAIQARVIDESTERPGRYTFSHALIRDVHYEQLTALRRTMLHRRIAVAIEEQNAGDLDPHLAELAHHFEHAAAPEDIDKAIAYSARAGDRAGALPAYEQAAAHYRHALQLLRRGDTASERAVERCDLTIAQGEAERMAGDPGSRETLLEGARLARELGDHARLAHAALANNRGFNSSSQGIDQARVAVLRAALDGLGEGDSATRAELLALLATELVADPDWRGRARLGDLALAMARRVGDATTLARTLMMRALSCWNPSTLAERVADFREAWRHAIDADAPLIAGTAAFFGVDSALEAGRLDSAAPLLESLHDLAGLLGQPLVEWYDAIARGKCCAIVGSPREAERLAFAAYEVGERAAQPDAVVWCLGQLFVARFLQCTLAGGEPDLPELFGQPGSSPDVGPEFTPSRSIPLLVSAAMSVILCEIGNVQDARRHFEVVVSELDDLPNDYSTAAILAQSSVACAHLGDAPRAERLHKLLEPFDGQFVNTGASWFGAVVHHLALLRATMGDVAGADAGFHAAVAEYRRLGADVWLARCQLDWAGTLLSHDRAQATALLEDVRRTAREHELPGLEQRATMLLEVR